MSDQPEIKRGAAFVFDGGTLEIKLSGLGAENGSGRIILDEDDVQWHLHDEKNGHYLEVKIPRSEMIEMRDWLIKCLNGEMLP